MPAERSESEGFYEMLWGCDHCGTKDLLALSQRHCPECGAPQNPDKRYYPPPGQQTRVEGHSYVGSDRHCPACNAPMSAKAKNCTQCGSPLDGSKDVRGVETPAAPPKRKRRIWPYIVGGVIVIGFAIWFFFIRKHEATLAVAAHRWQCAIAIEQFDTHQEGAWCDQLPAGAELPIAHRKQRSTRQVQDGEECHTERHDKKDGTFEQVKKCSPKYRSEPVEDNWCDYTIRKWTKVDDAKSSGTGTTPSCPTQALPPADTPATLGARRQGGKTETRTLDFGDGGTCDVDDPTWRKYADGAKVKVEVRARSGDVVCSSL
jgi:hypothetical protein